jgi:hypothetical protein
MARARRGADTHAESVLELVALWNDSWRDDRHAGGSKRSVLPGRRAASRRRRRQQRVVVASGGRDARAHVYRAQG